MTGPLASSLFLALVVGAAVLVSGPAAAQAPEPAAPPTSVPTPTPGGDIFTVSGIAVDAVAESATAARDKALAEGRPVAWTELYRRLTPESAWGRQPQLDDPALQRIIRSFEVADERRSTTRYLADVTYHFNAVGVRRLLRGVQAPISETRARPVLVLPLTTGQGFVADSSWNNAWMSPALSDGVVPLLVPLGDVADMAVLSRPDLAALDWSALQPLVARYGAAEAVIATYTEPTDVVIRYVTPNGSETDRLKVGDAGFAGITDTVARRFDATWKARTAVDYTTTRSLTAVARFGSLREWADLRAWLGQVPTVTDVVVDGVTVNSAELKLTFYGQEQQLAVALAQKNLVLTLDGAVYAVGLAPGAQNTASAAAP